MDLGAYCFYNCQQLTEVTLGESVTNWPTHYSHNNAFGNCTALKTVTVENGVNSIGISAFKGCTALESIVIPSSSVAVGDYAFNGCTSLKEATIYRGTIGIDAFRDCTSLESVTLRKVTYLGPGCFKGCTVLTGVVLPRTLVTLHNHAFENCPAITEMVIPDSTTFLGAYVFSGCTSLRTLYVGNNISEWGSYYGNNWLCCGCTALEYVYFSDGLTHVGQDALRGCSRLIGVYIPASVSSIDGNAFRDVPGCTIYGESGSIAESYANQKGIAFTTGAFPIEY